VNRDIDCRTHLPRDPRGEVFDDHAIVGSRRRSVFVDPGTAAAPATVAIATARPAGVLNGNPFSEELSAVEVVDGIVGVAVVVKFAKSVFAVLDEDVVDTSVLVEEPLDVPLPGVVRQVAQEHARGIAVFVGSPGGHGARYLMTMPKTREIHVFDRRRNWKTQIRV